MRPARVIAVTGHRRIPPDAAPRIIAAIHRVASDTPGATWLTGGAVGTDQIAAQVLLDRGERVELVLPFAPGIQAARWSGRHQDLLRAHVARAAAVHILSAHYHPAGYRDRNQHMVNRADLLLACWNGTPWSGTAMTVRMAETKPIPVIWVGMY